jgi:hypothetical protein
MSGRPAVSGSQPEKLVAGFEAEVFEQLDLESAVLVELARKPMESSNWRFSRRSTIARKFAASKTKSLAL